MKQYIDLCNHILNNGRVRKDRTGTGTISVFGYQMRFNLQEGFPLLTTKKMFTRGIFHEILWFLQGSTSNLDLNRHNVSIWDEWAITPEDVLANQDITKAKVYEVYVPSQYWFDMVFKTCFEPDSEDALKRSQILKDYNSKDEDYLDFLVSKNVPCTELIELRTNEDRERLLFYKSKKGLTKPDLTYDRYFEERNLRMSSHLEGVKITNIKDTQLSYVHETGSSPHAHGLEGMITDLLDHYEVPKIDTHPVVGELGPIYGKQWRSWDSYVLVDKKYVEEKQKEGYAVLNDFSMDENNNVVMYRSIDQIAELIYGLKTKPFSRRHIVSAWNVSDLPDETESISRNILKGKMALPPCHTLFQFYVTELTEEEQEKYWDKDKYSDAPKYGLSCQLYQRSVDTILGCPFNITSYALFTHMVAEVCGMIPLEFIHTSGDAHIYLNHVETFKNEQQNRRPYPSPKLTIKRRVTDIADFKIDDFVIEDYYHHPKVTYPISV